MTTIQERRPSWQRKGTDVTGLSFPDAIAKAGIDYLVKDTPAYARIPITAKVGNVEYPTDHVSMPIPGRKHTYRADTLEPLGEVGLRYHLIQTTEARDFVENVIGGGWEPEFAGPLQNGKAIFIVGKLPFETSPEIAPYLAIVNSFDGSTGLRLANTPIRPMCTNAVRRTFKQARAAVSFRHTANLTGRIEAVREALHLSEVYYRKLDDEIAAMMRTELDEQRVKQALDLLHSFKPTGDSDADVKAYERNQVRRAEFTSHWNNTLTIPDQWRHSVWGLVNAVSEQEQWLGRNSDSDKFADNLLGAHIGLVPAVSKAERITKLALEWVAA
jgi:phage/plasmid-like protein (TIGR03299 family)